MPVCRLLYFDPTAGNEVYLLSTISSNLILFFRFFTPRLSVPAGFFLANTFLRAFISFNARQPNSLKAGLNESRETRTSASVHGLR